MDSPQPPDQPFPLQAGEGAKPAPPTEPGETTPPPAQPQPGQPQQGQPQPAQPQPGQPYVQPAYAQQPYAQQPHYGYYQQPYAAGNQPPYGYPPHGAYYAQPGFYQGFDSGPDNGLANASLITAIISIAALVFTAGFSAPLSLIASIVAIVLGHKGKKAVDEGRTRKSRDVAVGGFWTGIAGVVLSIIGIAAWVIFFVAVSSTGGDADPGDLASILQQFALILDL